MNKKYLKTDNLEIGIKIKKIREEQNLSQPELAELIGIAQSTLCNIESGETKKINFSMMLTICEIFKVNIHYFINDNSQSKDNYMATDNISASLEKLLIDVSSLISKLNKVLEENRQNNVMP